jgi:hypothetical protein
MVGRAVWHVVVHRSTRGLFTVEMIWLLSLLFTLLVWSVLLFGPGMTVIHVGPCSIELACFALGVLGWWSVSPRLAAGLVSEHEASTAVRGSGTRRPYRATGPVTPTRGTS